MSLDEPALPRMFRPDSFPSFLTFEEGPDFDGPPTLAGQKIDPPATIFNGTFNQAVGKWGLPPPEIEDGLDGDVGQSDAEIVQQVYLKARGVCQQFEMFFTAQPLHTHRNAYGQANRVPYESLTLNELQLRLIDGSTASDKNFFDSVHKTGVSFHDNGLHISNIVRKYNPMGFFFAYVEDRMKNQTGMEVAYTCGSLCDIVNIWHVPIVPGMQLYLILMWVPDSSGTTRKMLVPYAGLGRPEEDVHIQKVIATNALAHKEYAVIDIGTVCVASNEPAQMNPGYSFVCQAGPTDLVPDYQLPNKRMTTDPVQIKHNILRVNVNMLQWKYYQQ